MLFCEGLLKVGVAGQIVQRSSKGELMVQIYITTVNEQ